MMRKILALAWLNAVQLLRNPAEVVAVVVLPLVLTMLFGSAFGGGQASDLSVLFVDEDGSPYAAQVGELVDAEESLRIVQATREEAEAQISAGDAAVAVLVPEGFGADLPDAHAVIEIMRAPTSQSGYAVFAVVQGIAMRMSGNAAAARVVSSAMPGVADFDEVYADADSRWEPVPPIYTEGQTVVASEVRGDSVIAEGTAQSSIGFTVWFILFMTFGSAGGILEEREQGTLRRLLVAPIGRGTILSGKVLGTVLAASVQALVLVLVGALAFGVEWGRDPLGVALVLGSYILAGTGLAVMVSALVRTRDQMSGLSPLVSTGLAMLGGCLWPLEIVSPFMQTIAKLTPTGWAVIGLTDVVFRNQGVEAAVVPTLILLGFAGVTLGIGVKMLKFE
ncbi:MAG: ABC transporter permease [Coriobacteriia bacterium]|nr:ABC transporter permease [Coriobacteriia bacterium]MBN2839470.1 ABC transporter permease [Coriobacteriia bacterium]